MPQIKMTSRFLQIRPLDGSDPPLLLVQVDVDCPQCGETRLDLHGIHVRGLHYLLEEAIRQFPEECGQVPDAALITQTRFEGIADPKTVRNN